MGLFQHLEGEAAVLVHAGVYKQADLFTKDGFLFAKLGGGYVLLHDDGATSKAKVRLNTLSYEGDLYRSPFGKLCISKDVRGACLVSSRTSETGEMKFLPAPAPEPKGKKS